MYNGIKYLNKVPSKTGDVYRVIGEVKTLHGTLKIDKYFRGERALLNAVKEANAFKGKIDNASKGFLTRAILAEKLGLETSTIEGAKTKNSPLWKEIKNLMEVKKAGVTSPEYYKFKNDPIETIKKLKSHTSGVGGPGVLRTQYRGKETVIAKVRNVLIESKLPLNVKDIQEKLTGTRPSGALSYDPTIHSAITTLKKQKEFKNKIITISPTEIAEIGAETKAVKRTPYLNLVRGVFVRDPDAGVGDVAEALFGSKKYNDVFKASKLGNPAAKLTLHDMHKEAGYNVTKFLQNISGKGFKSKIKGFGDISPDKLGDILESIESRVSEFGFESGNRRRLQLAIADAARGLPPGHSENLMKKLRAAGMAVDEVNPVAAVFKDAPGYIEATQRIPFDINAIKGTSLDSHFGTTLRNVLKGDFSGVKHFNEKSMAFAKEHKIDTPIMRTGKGLDPKDFIESFDKYTKGGQKNILQLAKEKNIVIETRAKPLQYIIKLISDLKPGSEEYNRVCGIGSHVVSGIKAAGGRVGYKSAGAVGSCQIIPALEAAPEQTMAELSKLKEETGALGKIRSTARGFLGMLGRGGVKAAPYAAIAAAGAAIEPLVKQFRSDDPTTYLSDENQQKGMLLSMIEGETPKVDEDILKWQYPGMAASAAAAIPGSSAMMKARRAKGFGTPRAALGPVGKFLAGSFSPLGVAATLPLHIAAQRKGGTDWGDIATDPMNWMAPAFASSGAKMATRGMAPTGILAKAIRMGMSPRALMLGSRFLGWPGLALTAGMWGYDKWKNRDRDD